MSDDNPGDARPTKSNSHESGVKTDRSSTVSFDVKYWSDEDRDALEKLPASASFKSAAANGFTTAYGDFLSYGTFTEQSDSPHSETFDELQVHLEAIQGALEAHYGLSDGNLHGIGMYDKASRRRASEIAGTAAALSLVGSLYDLHEADWQRIEETNDEKSLDYRIASNGRHFVELEAKGRKVEDVTSKASLYDAKSDITEKKREQSAKKGDGTPVDRIGVITTIPQNDNQKARCWLVDPPADRWDLDPRQYQLLARLTYYWKALLVISRSPMLVSLYNRILFVRHAVNWDALDGVPLTGIRGEPSPFPPSYDLREHPLGVDAFGDFVELPENTWFFYGFDRAVVRLLLKQRIKDILDFRSTLPRVLQGREVLIGPSNVEEAPEREPRRRQPEAERSEKKTRAQRRPTGPVQVKLYASADGRVFGLGKVVKESPIHATPAAIAT